MKVSIIIPNYNSASLLKDNLPKIIKSLREYKNDEIELIVTDDYSTDNSINVVEQIFKSDENNVNFKIIKNIKNLGFAKTVNESVGVAKGEIVILLNTDVLPEENFLKPLLDNFRNEKIFAVGCMDKSIEDGKTILRGRGVGEWKKGFLVHRRGGVDKNDTFWVSGGSGAFRRSIWKKLGGFNELYSPFYWEDIDLSYRARKSGYQILFESKSVVVHEHLRGSINTNFSKFKIKTISYRNQLIFVWTNITDIKLQAEHISWLPYHLVNAVLRIDVAFLLGFLQALSLFPKIVSSSLKYQETFNKKDVEII